MNIYDTKDPARLLRNAVMGIDGIQQVPSGTRIVYHTGKTWSLSESGRKVGHVARDLAQLGRVILCQRKLPGTDDYEWLAVVR